MKRLVMPLLLAMLSVSMVIPGCGTVTFPDVWGALKKCDNIDWALATRVFGGHSVAVEGYDRGGFYVISWGEKIYLTNAFMAAYNDEMWAPLASGIWAPNGVSPAGDAVPALDADLQAVA